METRPLQHRISGRDIPLERLAGNPNVSETDKRQAAARAFEAVLLRQILESAQKPVIPSALNTDSASKAIYRDLINTQLAEAISRSGQLGLAQTFEQQWQHQNRTAGATAHALRLGANSGSSPDTSIGGQQPPYKEASALTQKMKATPDE